MKLRRNIGEEGGGAKYPSTILIIPQLQLDDLGRQALGLLFCIPRGNSSEDQNALADGGDQFLFHSNRCRKHSLEYGCERLMRKAGNTNTYIELQEDNSPFILRLTGCL